MANYDRRILVPYLQDVCSAELICARLEREINECSNTISSLNSAVNKNYVLPKRPSESDYTSGCYDNFGAAVVGAVIALIGLAICSSDGWLQTFAVIGVGIMIFGGIMIFTGIADVSERVGHARERYEEEWWLSFCGQSPRNTC